MSTTPPPEGTPEPREWQRVTRTPGALYTPRTAGRRFRCDGHLADERHFIERGQRYVRSSLPPHHEIGNTGWWHMRLCASCCPVQYVQEVSR